MSGKEYDYFDLYCSVNILCYMHNQSIMCLSGPLNSLKFGDHA